MSLSRTEFLEGIKRSLPFFLSVAPFGAVVGTLGVANGASFFEVMAQSALFFAGASQTVMWELYPAGNPVWVVALAIFAVNFRLVLYSAAIGRKLEPLPKSKMLAAMYLLQDVSLAVGLQRADEAGRLTWHFYMGLSVAIYGVWLLATAIGASFGTLITDTRAVGLDMLVPVYFLCLAMGFRAKPNAAIIFAVSATASTLTYILVGSPYHIGTGGLCGMAIAALLAKPPTLTNESAPEVPGV